MTSGFTAAFVFAWTRVAGIRRSGTAAGLAWGGLLTADPEKALADALQEARRVAS